MSHMHRMNLANLQLMMVNPSKLLFFFLIRKVINWRERKRLDPEPCYSCGCLSYRFPEINIFSFLLFLGVQALSVLSRALEVNPTSVVLWIVYLVLFYIKTRPSETDDLYSISVCGMFKIVFVYFVEKLTI